MKSFAWIVFILTLISAGIVGIVIPNQFHKKIHKELIAESKLNGTSKIYKKLNYHNHLTTLSDEKFETKIISVSSFNPLDNHILVNVRPKENDKSFDFKIFAKVTDDIELHVQFKDYFSEGADGQVSLKSPLIIVSTPLSENLFFADKRTSQILTNTKIKFQIDHIDFSWPVNPESKDLNTVKINQLSWSLATSAAQQAVKLTNIFEAKEWSVATNEFQDNYKDFHQSLVFDSFNQKGLKDNFQKITDQLVQDVPVQAKLLPMMGNFTTLITSPFNLSYQAKVDQPAGPTDIEFKLTISDLAKGFLDAIGVSAKASIPKIVFDKQAIEFLAENLTNKYHEDFYRPDPDQNIVQPVIVSVEDNKQKLKVDFKNFLNLDNEGKKNIDLAIQKAVELSFLSEKDGFYLINASFANQEILLNDKVFSPTSFVMPELVQQQKITDYMLANGYQSRTLDTQKEWVLFEDPKLLQEYRSKILLLAKKSPLKEVLCKVQYKDLAGPQIQTMSAKASDKGGLPCLNWCKEFLQQKSILVNSLSHREGVKCSSDDIIQAFN